MLKRCYTVIETLLYREVSTGPVTRSLAPLTHLLAPHCSLGSRAPLRSFSWESYIFISNFQGVLNHSVLLCCHSKLKPLSLLNLESIGPFAHSLAPLNHSLSHSFIHSLIMLPTVQLMTNRNFSNYVYEMNASISYGFYS